MVCYDHDMARLYSLVTLMFHTDYHCHASINSELCADAIYFYESIIKVVFGQLPKDVFQARKEFFNFKLNLQKKSIQSEYQRWEQKIRNVQWALLNDNAIPECEKLAFIITLFQSDPRPGIAIAVGACQAQSLDYAATMKVILNIASNLSDEHGVIRLAAVSSSSPSPASPSGKTGYCFKFQKNNCSKGDSCQYKHVIDPNFKSRRPAAPTDKAKPPVKSTPKTGNTPSCRLLQICLLLISRLLVLLPALLQLSVLKGILTGNSI
jgi:hypothetical protein